ncbi:MAG: hypothetical protein Q9170_002766 [Blastenia crenularia]
MTYPISGYPGFAQLLGNNGGLAIFRRFATLNAQNLLYLQAELSKLEDELKDLAISDSQSSDEKRRSFQFNIRDLKCIHNDSISSRQWQKILEIRAKLKEYNETMLQHAQLYAFPKPNKHDLAVLREWYNDPEGGRIFMPMPEGDAWNEDVTDLDPDATTGLYIYEDSAFNTSTSVINMVLSSLLPPASIFALYYVHSTVLRLVIVTIFSGTLTACLALFTEAKKVEIFAATVALASVQVVFIGTNSPAAKAP